MIRTGVSSLLATSALVSFSILAPKSALAACSGVFIVNCTADTYTSPINVSAGPAQPISITLEPGVIVNLPAGGNAVNAANTGGVSVESADISIATIGLGGLQIINTANPLGSNNTGLRIQSSGAATINVTNTTIDVAGIDSSWGILTFAHPNGTGTPHDASVTWSGPHLISTTGVEGGGIQADNRGIGNATIVASGDINVIAGAGAGPTQYGLIAHSGDSLLAPSGAGDASVTFNSGTLNVNAIRPRGILAWAQGNGSATATTAAGTIINVSGTANGGPGVYVFSGFGTATAANKLTANVASEITSSGPEATNSGNLPAGIRALSGGGAQIDVTYTGTGITTSGGNGTGITALSSGTGNITVNSSGPINTTTGSNAVGILADSSGTILRRNPGLLTDIQPINPVPTATTGAVLVNTSKDVLAQGEFGTGISATSGSGDVTVNVQGGSVVGGWQADPTSVGSTYGLPAAGVLLGSASGTATLTNSGAIGASSDRAVASVPGLTGNVNIVNNGTITGYVMLGDGNDTFSNLTPNSFDIRDFEDTNGDGVRDTKRVAISDFGAGNDQFLNEANGVVRLLPVTGAVTTDATGYYVPTTGTDSRPLEASFYDLNREGVVQGQLVNLETFTNAGTIDLRNAAVGNAAPVVGNTLVITGNATAGGAAGTGLYVSNGGRLLVNTVLNGGIPIGGQTNSYSDMLIVDGTQLGAGGATAISATNVGGDGALTPGNGIELVEVRNKAASDPGAFTLAGDYVTKQGQQAVVGGEYAYTLQYGGIAGDSADGNWYLRSQFVPTPPGPTPPGPGPFPPNPPRPLFQAGVPLYEVYPQNLLALVGIPTMQQRVGNRYWQQPAVATEVFCKDPDQNYKCRVSEEQARYYGLGGQSIIESNGVWTRIEGSHFNIDPAETTSGTDYDTDLWKLQAGFDGLLHEAEDGSRLIGGITVHYGQANSDVTSIHGDGSIDSDGYGFGGTLTWLGQNGFYVDGQASLTWFNSDLSSDTAHRSLADGNDGFGYGLSVETGKKIDVSSSWTVTPQLQLVYANVDFDSFNDPFGADVSLGTGDSLIGRLGILADREQNWQDETGKTKRSHVYGIANLYYEFLDGSEVDVSGTKFETRPENLWGGIGAGGSYNWNDDKYSIYGEVSANTSLESFGDSYAFNGTAGFRVKW